MLIRIAKFLFPTILGTIIVLWNEFFSCQTSVGLQFDQQSFLYWDYVKYLDLIPYRDFFYPYGILFYLKIDSFGWNIVFILILFLIIGFIYKMFRDILGNSIYTIFLFFIFCIFASLFTDIDSFLRYFSILPLLYVYSFTSFKKEFFTAKNGLLIGFLLGLLISFINDAGVYALVAFFIFFLYNFISTKTKINKNVFLFGASFIFATFLGLTPFIYFLYSNHNYIGFYENYQLLKEVTLFAKVPFPPTLRSTENIVNAVLIVISILFLIYSKKRRISKFFVFSLLIIILQIEQKNIIRANYTQISALGFLLFLIIISEIITKYKDNNINRELVLSYLFMFLMLFISVIYIDRGISNQNYVSIFGKGSCFEKKISKIDKSKISNYLEVQNYLKNKNAKLFSFPGDPIFYILNNQKPPKYPSVYEATPRFAQKKQIEYIKNNDINYVIFNTKSEAIQDGVPDKIRNRLVYKYIQKNFKKDRKINEFLIMNRR